MAKKLILIGLFGLLVILPLGSNANAGCNAFYLAVYGICIQSPSAAQSGSYCVKSHVLKIKGDAAEAQPSFEVVLDIYALTVQWTNKNGKSSYSESFNFALHEDEDVPEANHLNSNFAHITKNGSWQEYYCFENDVIEQALADFGIYLDDYRQSSSGQWNVEFFINAAYFQQTLFVCKIPDSTSPTGYATLGDPDDPRATGCYIEDSQGFYTEAPGDAVLGEPFDYIETPVCDDSAEDAGVCPQTCPDGYYLTDEDGNCIGATEEARGRHCATACTEPS